MGDKREKIAFVYMGKDKGYLKVRVFRKRKEEDPDRVVVLGRAKEPLPGYSVIRLSEGLECLKEGLA